MKLKAGGWVLWLGLSVSVSAMDGPPPPPRAAFVRVQNGGFFRGTKPYRFAGTNLWYGMNLGADGAGADRARLSRELDRLVAMGVTNLRVLGASEGPDTEPYRIVPAMQPAPGVFEESVLRGLDFLLAEMGRRSLTAVVCLNDFWHWSGGMAQYRRWASGLFIPYPPPAFGGDWDIFGKFSAGFFDDAKAQTMAERSLRAVVTRRNTLTGVAYVDDPTIMAWELANEPRGMEKPQSLNRWIGSTSALLKTLDPHHLVTTGSEGETPNAHYAGVDFAANHGFPAIDFATAHIWAQNWGWYDPQKPETYDAALAKVKAYFQDHVLKAQALHKPLVIEEFGLSRDLGKMDPNTSAAVRERYYAELFNLGYESAKAGSPLAGMNFWAWAGEARPPRPGQYWRKGDPWLGDPPHEPQGWYSVYDSDRMTVAVISDFARKMQSLEK